ncbi:MAG: DNA methyltransferase [Planctomycetota bacterium]|nr:MAG: DNA methyltransferase [Planctomycetota bacterium]
MKYLGSKRRLVPEIVRLARELLPTGTVVDLFSGTARVGHALKAAGYRVLANDHLHYAETIARCYVQADREDHAEIAARLIRELNALPGAPGWFTETYCRRSRYLQPKNGARVDAIREAIAGMDLDPELEAILLVSLMEAADRVDSTTGVQMAYLKEWAPRSHNDLELRLPELLPRAAAGKGRAYRFEAREAARRLSGDLAYLDPPYNQHSYLGNYHLWESLVLWDKPETYGVAHKRVDCRERKSDFNRRSAFLAAWRETVAAVDARHLIVSFSDEGFLSREEMVEMLASRGEVRVLTHDSDRYVGARIGIHNPRGEKVGSVGRLRNREFLFVVRSRG